MKSWLKVRLRSCEKMMGWCTAQCKMLLFCVKAVVKESHDFELAHLRRRKRKRRTFGDLLVQCFAMLFMPLRDLLVMKTLKCE